MRKKPPPKSKRTGRVDLFAFVMVLPVGATLLSLATGAGLLQWYTWGRPKEGAATPSADPAFASFQRNYLLVYLLVMSSDWLQGPYVYKLYASYGFDKGDIGLLFIAGFLSSLLFGTFLGSLADKYGRKRFALFFCVIYIGSCITKLFADFWVLMLGRLFGGMATSLLFSVFESWMIFEHNRRAFPSDWLTQTLSLATFGNGLVAVGSGVLADAVVPSMGYVGPFMVALLVLVIVAAVVSPSWTENYGDSKIDMYDTFVNPINILRNNPRILLLGLVQSLFEASMYTFVFMWTPALQGPKEENLPFGLIFACYMTCVMIGASLFGVLVRSHPPDRISRGVLLCAALCLVVPCLTTDQNVLFAAFLAFEVCCGVWFPTIGTLRGQVIPESARAALMNFFRVPLNFLVCVVLLKVQALSTPIVFAIVCAWLFIAFILNTIFASLPSGVTLQRDSVTTDTH